MRQHSALVAILLALPAAYLVGACSDPSSEGKSSPTASGGGANTSTGTAGGHGTGGTPAITPPPPIPAAAVRIDPASTSSSPNGSASAPFPSLQAALDAGATDLRLCGDIELESLTLTTDEVSVTGGYNCSDWAPSTSPSTLTASRSPAVTVQGAKKVHLEALVLEAPAGTSEAPNSIALFLTEATDLSLVQVQLVAADGAAGADATVVEPYALTQGGNGSNGADGGTGCPQQTCPGGDATTGGDGANTGNNGDTGLPKTPVPPYKANNGGPQGADACGGGGAGNPGTGDLMQTPVTSPFGGLTAAGFTLAPSASGLPGLAGQGGGGGSGHPSASGRGGGGGCIGCGGKGASGAGPGGWSVALLAFESTVSLESVSLRTGKAGAGGAAALGQEGVGGGARGESSGEGCPGGRGAAGGRGGPGQAGFGGSSVGLLFQGQAPTLDDSVTFDLGRAGQAGTPLDTFTTTAANDGQVAETLDASTL